MMKCWCGGVGLAVWMTALLAGAGAQDIPLKVEGLTIKDGMVEFHLVNVGERPVTAWHLKVTTVTNGESSTSELEQDFAPSSGPEQRTRKSERGVHKRGLLWPFDFHLHRVPVYGTPEDVVVVATSVVFDDLTSMGAEDQVEAIFENRRTYRDEYTRWLDELDAIRSQSINDPRAGLSRLADRIEADLSRRGMQKSSDSVQQGLAQTIRYALRLFSNGGGKGGDRALYLVAESLRMQHAALQRHTPDKR